MRIVAVLDLMQGQVVRGLAGRREEYRPIVSHLTGSSLPGEVARAFRDQLGLAELYLADLDAIAGSPPALATYKDLLDQGFCLWVDAGVRRLPQARLLAQAGVARVVVGLETVVGPEALAEIAGTLGAELVFSLDLRDGTPLGDTRPWRAPDSWSIAVQAVGLGVRRLLVLDLARVGVGGGTGTEALCTRLAATYPELELSAGGGVRSLADLHRLRACGVRAALVASSLHQGNLGRDELRELAGPR